MTYHILDVMLTHRCRGFVLPGKKRLDLAGVLLGGLFRQLFFRLSKDVKAYLKACINENKKFSMGSVSTHQSTVDAREGLYHMRP
jgi:DNA-directed RNA polymerase beta subunit